MLTLIIWRLLLGGPVRVEVGAKIADFVPADVLGAGLDGHEAGEVPRIYRDHNLDAMKRCGLGAISYRLRTELAGEAWHWNPEGHWSEPGHRQGYWTSSAVPNAPIRTSFGYRLPRRGNTRDQANGDGYSRIDDGDLGTYWKSNPYLDRAYDPAIVAPAPQWVVIDLGRRQPVDTIRIHWANPYATQYAVESWFGAENLETDEAQAGHWRTFPNGLVVQATGGVETRRLGRAREARFIRIRLLASSHTAEPSSTRDPRNSMGFAIREIEIGRKVGEKLVDGIQHRANSSQTLFYTSSTDPWHREIDRDHRVEQPGFDLLFDCGITRGRPVLTPLPVLYDTPENALAEVAWLRARNYPIRGLELGEEPDGQYVDPETFAAMFARLASRLSESNPSLPTGGPSLQNLEGVDTAFPDDRLPASWTRRFIAELKRERRVRSLNFFSFEWYPCEDLTQSDSAQLQTAASRLSDTVKKMKADGLGDTPWMITEYGFSAFACRAEVDLPGALLNLDIVGRALQLGASAAFLYGYEPGELISERNDDWGNLMTWLVDGQFQAKYPLAGYWACQVLTKEWLANPDDKHSVLATACSDGMVSAYAVRRPDQNHAVLLINKDPVRRKTVDLRDSGDRVLSGRVAQWGPDQYVWHPAMKRGYPLRSQPPKLSHLVSKLILPPMSATTVVYPGRDHVLDRPRGIAEFTIGSNLRPRPTQRRIRRS